MRARVNVKSSSEGHSIIMHGPFPMAQLTNHVWLNILLMLFTTAISTYLFVIALGCINKFFY